MTEVPGQPLLNFPEGTKEVIIRQAKAKDELPLKNYRFERAHLSSVKVLIFKLMYSGLDLTETRCVCEVDYTARTIEFIEDVTATEGVSCIKAVLEVNPDLKNFNINEPVTYTKDKLLEKVKFSKLYMNDEEYNQFISSYMSLKVSIDKQLSMMRDNQGSKDIGEKSNVSLGVHTPLSFNLQMPIFNGTPSVKFKVDVLFDLRDAGVDFWLQSVELKQLMDEKSKEYIGAVVEDLRKQFGDNLGIVERG